MRKVDSGHKYINQANRTNQITQSFIKLFIKIEGMIADS